MKGFREINNIINDEDFLLLSKTEQRDYLIETLEKFIENEALKKHITFNSGISLKDKIIGINSNMSTQMQKEFNIKLINSIINIMSVMQEEKIIFEILNNRSLKNPMYTFSNGRLIYIRSYVRTNQIEVIKYLINLNNKFIIDLENTQKLSLKK